MNAAPPAHSFIWRRERSEVNALSVGAGIGREEALGSAVETIGPVWRGEVWQVGGWVRNWCGLASWASGRMNAVGRNCCKIIQLIIDNTRVELECNERQEVGLRVVVVGFEFIRSCELSITFLARMLKKVRPAFQS